MWVNIWTRKKLTSEHGFVFFLCVFFCLARFVGQKGVKIHQRCLQLASPVTNWAMDLQTRQWWPDLSLGKTQEIAGFKGVIFVGCFEKKWIYHMKWFPYHFHPKRYGVFEGNLWKEICCLSMLIFKVNEAEMIYETKLSTSIRFVPDEFHREFGLKNLATFLKESNSSREIRFPSYIQKKHWGCCKFPKKIKINQPRFLTSLGLVFLLKGGHFLIKWKTAIGFSFIPSCTWQTFWTHQRFPWAPRFSVAGKMFFFCIFVGYFQKGAFCSRSVFHSLKPMFFVFKVVFCSCFLARNLPEKPRYVYLSQPVAAVATKTCYTTHLKATAFKAWNPHIAIQTLTSRFQSIISGMRKKCPEYSVLGLCFHVFEAQQFASPLVAGGTDSLIGGGGHFSHFVQKRRSPFCLTYTRTREAGVFQNPKSWQIKDICRLSSKESSLWRELEKWLSNREASQKFKWLWFFKPPFL